MPAAIRAGCPKKFPSPPLPAATPITIAVPPSLLVKALANPTHGLAGGKYGVAFWEPIAQEYNKLQPKVAKATGDRAAEVGDKATLVAQATALLVAVLLLIEANYPNTYKAERRKFGFLKESY